MSSSSIPAPGNLEDTLTVAAIDWRSYASGPAEDYSSRGPTNDGRTKPDLAAPDNVTTGVPYYSPFPGTSAAAPHVSGIAALLLSEDPSLSSSALRARLLSMCVPMGDPYTYGAGRLEARPQGPAALPDLVIQSITYTPASPTVGTTITFQVTVKNQGGAPAGQFAVSFAGDVKTVYGLAAGESSSLTFYATFTSSPQTFTAVADPYGQVTESNETNNQRQVTITAAVAALVAEAGGPYSGQVGQAITFDGRGSQGPIVSYTWDFGDGFSGTGAVVTHAYSMPGTYTVRLTVRDSYGRTATDTAQVTVSAPTRPDLVIEDISYTPSSPQVGQQVTFQVRVKNQGGAPAGAFYVRLEGAAGHQNAYLSGLAAGSSHTVTLRLPLSRSTETFTATADYLGQVAESDETNNIRQVTITTAAPPLSFSLSLDRSSYAVGDPVRITVQLSQSAYVYLVEVDASGKAILIFPNWWERDPRLPAGATELPRAGYTIEADAPTGAEALHGFAADRPIPYFPTGFSPGFPILHANGAYFLSQVRNWLAGNVPTGAWAEASAGFTVQPQANLPPRASFSYSPAGPEPGQWITFDASGSSDPDGRTVSYAWDFGDGTTATGIRVNKRYSSAGSYTVRLTVRDDRGATDTEAKTVSVGAANQPPQARFSFSPASPDPRDVVHFDASGSSDPDGTVTSYAWDFGDGTTGSGVTVNHAFPAAGAYSVTLTVTDNAGATDSETKTVQVGTPTILPGMPTIDQPGIYVWGDPQDHWHITVAGSSAWSSPRKFQVVLESQGAFQNRVVTPGGPQPSVSGGRLTWEGTVGVGWVDLRFDLVGATLMKLWLYLDIEGDGVAKPKRAADAKAMVFLRSCKTNPPGNPLAIYAPRGATALLPHMDFLISVVRSDGSVSPVHWRIEYWEAQAGCQ